jgi:uncharacterized protein
MKYLVLFAVLALAYALWRQQRRSPPPQEGARPPSAPAAPQDMVACAHCGVHLPRNEAITLDTRHYCCAEHQQRDAR